MLKILILGASGYVGRMLVPELISQGAHVVLFGRSLPELAKLFPNQQTRSYKDLKRECEQADLILNLSVINNNKDAPAYEFEKINVKFPTYVARLASKSPRVKFLNFNSTHALDGFDHSKYAVSKRICASLLRKNYPAQTVNLFLPYVYGAKFRGVIFFLNVMPKRIQLNAVALISALKPMLSVNDLGVWIMSNGLNAQGDVYLTGMQKQSVYYRFLSRTFELFMSVFGLLIFCIPFLVYLICLLCDRRDPVFFSRYYLGLRGKCFRHFGLRTHDEKDIQQTQKSRFSQYLSSVISFFERFYLDYFLCLLNVLTGSVALVGPSVCSKDQVNLILLRQVHGVFAVKPGIFSLSSLEGININDEASLIKSDIRYIACRCLFFDLICIYRSIRQLKTTN